MAASRESLRRHDRSRFARRRHLHRRARHRPRQAPEARRGVRRRRRRVDALDQRRLGPAGHSQSRKDLPVSDAHSELGQRTLRKVAWRLIPFMGLLYFLAFVDRVNIGFAALTMNADLGLTSSMFGFASGIFFIAYALFE